MPLTRNAPEPAPRIVLGHPRRLPRNRLVELLQHHGAEVVGQGTTLEAIRFLAAKLKPDVILLHAALPGQLSASDAADEYRQSAPGCRIIGLDADSPSAVCCWRTAGVEQVLSCTTPPQRILHAILGRSGRG